MLFNNVYHQFNKYIHYLLNKYHIRYNYDEYYQLMLIRLWQLTNQYNASLNSNFSTFIIFRLNYYLIDLFRKEQPKQSVEISILNPSSSKLPIYILNDFNLIMQEAWKHLTRQEQQWLILQISGYKQYEIAQQMHVSLSSVKNYKRNARQKLQRFFT